MKGVRIFQISKNVDERGLFAEILRDDWQDNLLGEDQIRQANLSISYPGMIRAWHRHTHGQVDYFLVLRGAVKICAYDDIKQELDQIVSSSEKLQVIRIPGYYWHGFKNIGDQTAMVVYFVNKLYDYSNPDEERRPWNDRSIIDGRTGTSFDWNRPPHR